MFWRYCDVEEQELGNPNFSGCVSELLWDIGQVRYTFWALLT